MDYEKKYKAVLKRAKEILECSKKPDSKEVRMVLSFFPELKEESEDERIRKSLVQFFKEKDEEDFEELVPKAKVFDWLERQGKNKVGISEATKKELENNLNKALEKETPESWNEFIEKQGEQKPKFRIGDWVVYECEDEVITLQIKNIVDGTYEFTDDSTLNVVDEDTLRLWTIEDAKDGDALYNKDDFAGNSVFVYKGVSNKTHACLYYTRLFKDKDFSIYNDVMWGNGCGVSGGEFYPATKKQRDTLMKAIHEAGYMWDIEGKQLVSLKAEPNTSEWSRNVTDFKNAMKL